jgi:hypothetical protein
MLKNRDQNSIGVYFHQNNKRLFTLNLNYFKFYYENNKENKISQIKKIVDFIEAK